MPLSTYSELQTAVLGWLARPGDPLVAPAVPDMITLFESEANRRLRVIDAERDVILPVPAGDGVVLLPGDCWSIRTVWWNNAELGYMPPGNPVFSGSSSGGDPRYYTLLGFNQSNDPPLETKNMWVAFYVVLGPAPPQSGNLEVVYQVGVPPLTQNRPVNWLLQSHPDAYLFGALAEAELYIGHDERAPMWLSRRDASLQSIENMDRKTRWAGPMQIRAHGIQVSAGSSNGGGAAPAPVPVSQATAVRLVNPASGAMVVMLAGERALYVDGGPRAALIIQLPPDPLPDVLVEIGFANPVTALTMIDSDGAAMAPPDSAYGPGAGLQFRYLDSGWAYWK